MALHNSGFFIIAFFLFSPELSAQDMWDSSFRLYTLLQDLDPKWLRKFESTLFFFWMFLHARWTVVGIWGARFFSVCKSHHEFPWFVKITKSSGLWNHLYCVWCRVPIGRVRKKCTQSHISILFRGCTIMIWCGIPRTWYVLGWCVMVKRRSSISKCELVGCSPYLVIGVGPISVCVFVRSLKFWRS